MLVQRRLMQKDVALALDTARELDVPLPSAATVDQLLTVARALGYERATLASLYRLLGRSEEAQPEQTSTSARSQSAFPCRLAMVRSSRSPRAVPAAFGIQDIATLEACRSAPIAAKETLNGSAFAGSAGARSRRCCLRKRLRKT